MVVVIVVAVVVAVVLVVVVVIKLNVYMTFPFSERLQLFKG